MYGFLARHADKLKLRDQGMLMLGVGAAFDFQAGLVKEAPAILRGSGFEWLFRLCVEPKRLWRRYLRNNPKFLVGVLLQAVRPTRYPMVGKPLYADDSLRGPQGEFRGKR